MDLNRNGIIGTTIFHALVAILLIFFGFSYPDPPPEEEGILVNFGTDFTGYGDIEPAGDDTQGGKQEAVVEKVSEEPVPEVEETIPASPPPTEQKVIEEQVQDFEESPVKENKPTPEEIRQQKIEAEKERQKQLELEKQRQAEHEGDQAGRQGETLDRVFFGFAHEDQQDGPDKREKDRQRDQSKRQKFHVDRSLTRIT